MRIRHALTSLALGSALALGAAAAPAQAAGSTPSAQVSAIGTKAEAPSWHYHSTYYNNPDYCHDAGKAQGLPYKCEMGLPGAMLPFYLYLWY